MTFHLQCMTCFQDIAAYHEERALQEEEEADGVEDEKPEGPAAQGEKLTSTDAKSEPAAPEGGGAVEGVSSEPPSPAEAMPEAGAASDGPSFASLMAASRLDSQRPTLTSVISTAA
jgi:hypothetical protein